MPDRREPERMCVACRGHGPKRELVRVVRRPDGTVVLDTTGRAPGRGAYVHPNARCLNSKAVGALGRALGAPLPAAEAARLLIESRGAQEAQQ